jgi:hypothetical protein
MRQTVIVVTILIVGVSLAIGLLVGNLAGGGDAPTATWTAVTPTTVPSSAAPNDGPEPARLNPWG